MLNGISPLLSPDLLAELSRMGHGDRLVLADAHFPGHSVNRNVIRADGLKIPDLLRAILPLFPVDNYDAEPIQMMQSVAGDQADPTVRASYKSVIEELCPESPEITEVERFAFYEVSRKAFLVVMTGDTAKYGNIILTKGVVGD